MDAGVQRWNDDGSADVLVATKVSSKDPGGKHHRERKPLGGNGKEGRTAVEDQPTDSGDLTTDADSAPSTPTPRGRHRMPSGKKLRTTKPEEQAAGVRTRRRHGTGARSLPQPSTRRPRRRRSRPPKKCPPRKRSPKRRPPKKARQAGPPAELPPAPQESADRGCARHRRCGRRSRRRRRADAGACRGDGGRQAGGSRGARRRSPRSSKPAADEPAVEAADEPVDVEAVAEEPVLVPHRPAGKRLKVAAAAAAALFVAGGAFLGATAQP